MNRYGMFRAGVLMLACLAVACQRQEEAPPAETAIRVDGVNDQLILAASLVALPPPGVSPGDLPEPDSPGARAVAEFCVACHNLPSPAIHSATDWPGVARRMWLRIEELPGTFGVKNPTVQQRQVALDYLLKHALQVSGAALPQAPGRATFSQTCSRCHALPDPRQHSAADWPAVVMRMEERMTQMKVDRPSAPQTQEIIGYLTRVSRRP
jgi:cytochrome c5